MILESHIHLMSQMRLRSEGSLALFTREVSQDLELMVGYIIYCTQVYSQMMRVISDFMTSLEERLHSLFNQIMHDYGKANETVHGTGMEFVYEADGVWALI